tara:strand:- start:452 stop:715 length:264 start_codon:yes stop_codon:yes gene_type:complete
MVVFLCKIIHEQHQKWVNFSKKSRNHCQKEESIEAKKKEHSKIMGRIVGKHSENQHLLNQGMIHRHVRAVEKQCETVKEVDKNNFLQ